MEANTFEVEELEEVQEIVERGHDWGFIDKITITLIRHSAAADAVAA